MSYQVICRKLFPAIFCLLYFLPIRTTAQLANQVLVLEFTNRRYEGTTYFADLSVIVMPNKEWPVCDAVIWINFNLNALDGTPFNRVELLNCDSELQSGGYQITQSFYGGQRQAISVDILAPMGGGTVTKYGGSNGSSFRLGTVRWTAIAAGGMDGLLFGRSGLVESTIYFRASGGECQLYDGKQGRGQVNYRPQISLYINPLGCTPSYYNQRTWCRDELRELNTAYPLTVISPHWPAIPGPSGAIHQARYQYNFRIDIPTEPLRIRGFNANDIPALTDRARCRWEAQIDQLSFPVTNNFEWVETTRGGRFYFTENFLNFLPSNSLAIGGILAETKTAFDSDGHWQIRDSSQCGNSPSWSNRSEIVFNNTELLYTVQPHIRWTTDLRICGDGADCIDFYTIMLHELGHYLGLAHQQYNHKLIMSKAEIWPKQAEMTWCDAENIRRLYNPSRMNAPIDNSYDCSRFTSVQGYDHDQLSTEYFRIIGELDDYSVIYVTSSPNNIELNIYNTIGQKVVPVFQGLQSVGEHIIPLPTQTLPTGVYFVRIKTDVATKSQTFSIVR